MVWRFIFWLRSKLVNKFSLQYKIERLRFWLKSKSVIWLPTQARDSSCIKLEVSILVNWLDLPNWFKKDSYILVDQIRTVSKCRISRNESEYKYFELWRLEKWNKYDYSIIKEIEWKLNKLFWVCKIKEFSDKVISYNSSLKKWKIDNEKYIENINSLLTKYK